jgi:membrane protein DedA with SNARE-associated domain
MDSDGFLPGQVPFEYMGGAYHRSTRLRSRKIFIQLYISKLSNRFIKQEKNTDLQFIGKRLEKGGWRVQLFVFIYTLMPLPSTPLFTATGVAKIKVLHIIPAFLVGKFISDAIMAITGDYIAQNLTSIIHGLLSWKTIAGTFIGLIVICFFLFTNWRQLLEQKKYGLSFKIWK